MTYHGQVVGPDGLVYYCEHNHRTLAAAVTCANSSATLRMAAAAWNRAAVQAAQAAALAEKREQERAAAEEARAAKRAAKLAAMSPRRAWRRMTPEERLLKTAEAELAAYGEIKSPDAKAAYDARAARRAAPAAPAPPRPAVAKAPAGRKPAARASAGFGGDGLFVVGLDIRPGVYRTAGAAAGGDGYFALLKSTNTDDIVDNGSVKGPMTITVGPGVKAVEVSGCQPWRRLGDNLDAVIAAAGEAGSPPSREPRP